MGAARAGPQWLQSKVPPPSLTAAASLRPFFPMISSDTNAPLRGARVIIADHHAHTRTALREMVSTLGATSISNASDAADVIRQVKARQLDVILCDYTLDGMRDGQQLLEELRHDLSLIHI